jgi:hypothetical protein
MDRKVAIRSVCAARYVYFYFLFPFDNETDLTEGSATHLATATPKENGGYFF